MDLFDSSSADPAAEGAPGPRGAEAGYPGDEVVWFGTSSFSETDWVGPFYPPGTPPREFLSFYSTRFRTVEVDATYYAVPAASTVDGWAEKTGDDFLLCAKFPKDIVHCGDGPRPDPSKICLPDETYETRDRFLATMARLGPKRGPLLIQFPYFNKQVFAEREIFFERLDGFLADLPRGDGEQYAVEIRNRAWLKEEFFAMLARHRVTPALVDQAWMPHGDEIAAKRDILAGGPLVYVRLLGDRKRIEAITTSWEKEVLDYGESLTRWAALLADLRPKAERILVYANNHYAGHAPATIRRLNTLYHRARS